MNRYRGGGPSKATASTLCQKCLKRGHYTYECTAAQQERPYLSRPSRSQQLLNPKLAPKLSATMPPVDSQSAAKSRPEHKERSSALDNASRATGSQVEVRRRRSVSSDSVSTISTNRSESRSPSHKRQSKRGRTLSDSSRSRSRESRSRSAGFKCSSNPPLRQDARTSRSPQSQGDHYHRRSAGPPRSRLPRRSRSRSQSRSPVLPTRRPARQRSRSRSPYRGRGSAANDRQAQLHRPASSRWSLSPYSRRMALTKAANTG